MDASSLQREASAAVPRTEAPANLRQAASRAAPSRRASPGSEAKLKLADPGGPLDIELLLFYNAVAETLSFTKAAKALSIDQSWLSHKIRQFEATLGVSLFIRNTRHVELTTAGKSLLDPMRRLAQVASQARASADALRVSMSGILRVGALPFSFPDPQRTALLDRLMKTHAEVQLVVTNGPTPELLDHLRAGRIDLAFVSAPFDAAGLDALLLRENRFCMLIPNGHALAERAALAADDLRGVKIVLPSKHYSPAAFEAYYEPILAAGAAGVHVPEFQSAVAYAREWNLPVVCTAFAAERGGFAEFTVRPLDFIPPCQKFLVRLSNHRIPSQTTLFSIAEEQLQADAAKSTRLKRV